MNDMNTAMSINPVEKAVARSRIYALLATGFRYPEDATFAQFSDGSYANMLAGAIGGCATNLLDHFEKNLAPRLLGARSWSRTTSVLSKPICRSPVFPFMKAVTTSRVANRPCFWN